MITIIRLLFRLLIRLLLLFETGYLPVVVVRVVLSVAIVVVGSVVAIGVISEPSVSAADDEVAIAKPHQQTTAD